jgi:hypothetical protein
MKKINLHAFGQEFEPKTEGPVQRIGAQAPLLTFCLLS